MGRVVTGWSGMLSGTDSWCAMGWGLGIGLEASLFTTGDWFVGGHSGPIAS